VKNCHHSRIRRVFHDYGIARTHKRFTDQIERLLAAIGDQQVFIFGRDAIVMQHLEQSLFQRRIAVRRPKIQHFRRFALQHGVHASLQFLNREKFFRRSRHDKGQRIFRQIGRQTAKHLFSSLIGEEQLPPDSAISIQHRRRRRSDLQSVAISLDERAAPNVSLNQSFRFEFSVGVRHGGAVHAEHSRKLAAGRNAVTGAQIARMNKGPQLIAKLDVQRNVTLWLEMEWQHCLSPSANSTRYWPGARANLSFSTRLAFPRRFAANGQEK